MRHWLLMVGRPAVRFCTPKRQILLRHPLTQYCRVEHPLPFDRHDISLADVDTALLKDARDRVLTRSIARWLYDLHEEAAGEPVVDGVRFNSRHGDEIRVWAVFERADDLAVSPRIQPVTEPLPVPPDLPELQEAFARFGLHWHEG